MSDALPEELKRYWSIAQTEAQACISMLNSLNEMNFVKAQEHALMAKEACASYRNFSENYFEKYKLKVKQW